MLRCIPVLFLVVCFRLPAQERVTTFGIQVKPIIPTSLLDAGTESVLSNGIEYRMNQRLGNSFGGVIRHGFTRNLSVESGINFVRRNYRSSMYHTTTTYTDSTDFRVIGYEVPLLGMVFVRLSDKIYMDVAFGAALTMFPSDVGSSAPSSMYFQQSFRNRGRMPQMFAWMQGGAQANVGFEYRTEKKGYFYIGASYHRPFRPIYTTMMVYDPFTENLKGFLMLSGNYLTVDLRYFFHEEPKEKTQKVDEKDLPGWMKYGK